MSRYPRLEQWKGRAHEELYLNGNSSVLQPTPSTDKVIIEYDPLNDPAIFSHQFNEDTELNGHMKLKLWVATCKGADMDLFIVIKKLDAQGKEVPFYAKTGYTKGPVAMGWLQPVLTHRNPQKLAKNEVVSVEIEILPSSTLFRKGETLQLVIQGKDFFNHPAMGHHYSMNRGKHSIFTGEDYDSHLLVPIIPTKTKH